ncbi:DUF134 domain-containing protein [Candidatus Contubernalis alkaliaceticus]|uniref:DUF134 domain-containing protein n=1 Tax=Candidatus Contubernalis alkaliaceticus TaxID=338645 RepID=UPI001F4C0B30|nr:DUF134 domain-containing protein [Candidatus Contubernalis alkalaceticus]UNC93281.1 DUF134 domain-containing protein [Candidatus Contubernalis alkalaceticus]
MPRPTKWRHVQFMPKYGYFKPAGVPLKDLEEVILHVEELEAIRLKDKEGLEQEACAEKMNVSRPTFQRILSSARGKLAEALTQGKAIKIEGGNFKLASRHIFCKSCDFQWQAPFGSGDRARDMSCPRCSKRSVSREDNSLK